jgi:aspartate/methionine/tyrosine aminotransferase
MMINYMKVKPADRTCTVQEYYFSTKLRQIEMMRKEGADIINLGIGSPDMSPSENTLKQLVMEVMKPHVHGYQSYNGIPILRKSFAEWYKKYFNVSLNPDNEILPLMGSKEGIMHISMAFVNPGDEVLVPDPGYPAYASATNLVGGIVRNYPLEEKKGWFPDLKELEDSDLGRVKLMWVNYPHMPTGTKGSPELFEKLVSFAFNHNILICNDNPYSFILNTEHNSILFPKNAREVALELNSLSKSHNMAGWRMGMVAGNKDYIATILKVKSNMDSGMFLPIQIAAAEALNNPESWYTSINTVYRKRRKIAEELMETLSCTYNPGQVGLFLWGRLPEKIEGCEIFVDKLLLNAHIFLTPGFIFGKKGERYIRISLCSDEETLKKAKERVAKLLQNTYIIE